MDLETRPGADGPRLRVCYTPIALKPIADLIEALQPVIEADAVAPLVLAQKLQERFRSLGPQGFPGIVQWRLSTWRPGTFWRRKTGSGLPQPRHGWSGPAAQEAAESIELDFQGVKFKVGYPHVEQDRAARGTAGKDMRVTVDYNQGLSAPEAIGRVQLLEEEALVWVEEPTRPDDFAGHARIAAECHTPIQLGENLWGLIILQRASPWVPQTL